jgi:uncharacterized protein YndB with AHSA1/START domain
MQPDEVYRLEYTWKIAGRIDTVFHYISHIETFPRWWPAVFLDWRSDDPVVCVGAKATVRARSILPYVREWKLVVTALEAPRLIALDTWVTLGGKFALKGTITYRLVEEGAVVQVLTDHSLRPSRPLPGLLRGLAGRIFRLNHAWAMARGERGLQRIVDERI